MDETPWRQINVTYPGPDPQQRERQAIAHLTRVFPAAEADGLITSWWFIRKGAWRIRYLLTTDTDDAVRAGLTDSMTWSDDIYEPEAHAFGGRGSMDTAHMLFHHDSRHLLTYLRGNPYDRREHSLVLCTAFMRTAGLDFHEQGDVWARIEEQRAGASNHPPRPDPRVWASFASRVGSLLLGTARADIIASDWLAAFEDAGRNLRVLRENGELTRGIRAVVALHVIFHWNRIGLASITQATLARAAKDAVFGRMPG